ncbi:MAG: TetR/AcrR family transcriptional regulator [Fimbriimonadaceae bacterium]|nr:TetR/AcrR family transcriptional regulator [Fimbriimonadaceae bacterium]
MPRDASATKRKILEAARDAFAEQGLAGSRIEEICARAGVNVRMVYAHFGSKQGLYDEVIREVVLEERASQPPPTHGDPAEELESSLDRFLLFCERNESYVSLMLREAVDGYETLNRVFEPTELGVSQFVELIHRGQATGAFRKDLDPLLVGASMISLSLHLFRVLRSRGMREGGVSDASEVRRQVRSILLQGVSGAVKAKATD